MIFQVAVLAAGLLAPTCDVLPNVFGPAPGESIMLVRHTGATDRVPAPLGPLFRPALSQVLAYEFEVLDASRAADPSLGWGLVAPGDRVLLVPWDLDAGCDYTVRESLAWVPRDSLAVVRASAARRHSGRPLIDVVTAPSGYPYVDRSSAAPALAPPNRKEWIPAEEYFRILLGAPQPASSEPRSGQLQRVEQAFRTGPTYLLSRFPGPQLLDWYRRWAAAGIEGGR